MNKSLLCFVIAFMMMFSSASVVFAQQDQTADFIFKGKLVNGSIKEVKTAENIIVVDSKSGETVEFVVLPEETVIWIDDEEKDIASLQSGMDAELKYTENEREQKILSWIDIVLKEELDGAPMEAKQKKQVAVEKKDTSVEVKNKVEDTVVEKENTDIVPEKEDVSASEDKKTVEKTEVKSQ